MRAVLLAFLVILTLPLARASAHPADMYAQQQTVRLTREGAELDWKITPGPMLAVALWNEADRDGNGSISPGEGAAWARPLLSNLSLALDGKAVGPLELKTVTWPEKISTLETGDQAIEIVISARWPQSLAEKHSLEIHNTFQETISLNWFTLSSLDGLSMSQPAQNNGLVSLDLTPGSPPGWLTGWESGRPTLPGLTGAVSSLAANLAAPGGAGSSPTGIFSTPANALTGLIRTQTFSPLFLISAFFLSLALGSLHALTPGHGKTLVAAYLVGSRGRTVDAITLGSIVTLTHTGSVLLLGLAMLVASRYILPTLAVPILEIVSGLLIVLFGANLVFTRGRGLYRWYTSERQPKFKLRAAGSPGNRAAGSPGNRAAGSPGNRAAGRAVKAAHAAVLTPHAHDHAKSGAHTHAHPGEHSHAHTPGHEHEHEHSHALPEQITWRSLLALGVSGGLVPCPDAIAILLVAVAVNRIPLGMVLIVAFSLGLAFVLIAIGIAMVNGGRLLQRSRWMDRVSAYTPAISAVVVLGLGIGLTITAFQSFTQAQASQNLANAGTGLPSSAPAFDLDQARILYTSEDKDHYQQLMIRSLRGGDPLQLTRAVQGVSNASLSPDGKTIAYTEIDRAGKSSIHSIDVDGSHARELLKCPEAMCYLAVWSPDGKQLIYERHDAAQNVAVPVFSIWWLKVDSGETQPVFQDQHFPSFLPRFSHDGTWLSYLTSSRNSLEWYNLKDGTHASIPYTSGMAEVWSPMDDSFLYWEVQRKEDQSYLVLKRFELDGQRKITLTPADGRTDNLAAWSPDGQWIAVARGGMEGSPPEYSEKLWLVKADGSQAQPLVDLPRQSYGSLAWAPDSRTLLYSAYSFQERMVTPHAWQVNVQSGERKEILAGATNPVFLPGR